ncbi:MAG: ribonuclease P protein component [Kineosporiaceae bacterium]
MLPRRQRLRDSADFTETVKSRCRVGSRTLVVHWSPGDASTSDPSLGEGREAPGALEPCRVGLIVSKAVGGSVERSRVKRRLRHAAMPLLLDLPSGSRLVIRANPCAAQASYSELEDDLRRCVRRATGGVPVPRSRRHA